MAKGVVEFREDNFEQEVLKSDIPVLVDFWAEWCVPCLRLGPTIEKLALTYEGKVKIGKLDTEAQREVAIRYGISSIPTIILFKNGEIQQKMVGARPEREFVEALEALIKG